MLITPTAWPSTNVCSSYRPSKRNYLITILCGSVSGSGDTCGNYWLLVPLFTCAFLKSPSSRGLSAIAELLVLRCNTDNSDWSLSVVQQHFVTDLCSRQQFSFWFVSLHDNTILRHLCSSNLYVIAKKPGTCTCTSDLGTCTRACTWGLGT